METLTSMVLNCSAAAIDIMIGCVIYYHYKKEVDSVLRGWVHWLRAWREKMKMRAISINPNIIKQINEGAE